jgi:hypothetical protein
MASDLTMKSDRSQDEAERARDITSSSDTRPAMLDVENPWPGLAAYDEASSDFFRGRHREAQELLRLIRLASLTVLYGKSGLVHRFHETDRLRGIHEVHHGL